MDHLTDFRQHLRFQLSWGNWRKWLCLPFTINVNVTVKLTPSWHWVKIIHTKQSTITNNNNKICLDSGWGLDPFLGSLHKGESWRLWVSKQTKQNKKNLVNRLNYSLENVQTTCTIKICCDFLSLNICCSYRLQVL